MINQEKFELAKSLLLDFKKYVLWIHKLAQGTEYDMTNGHIKVCDKLQERAEGKNVKRNLMINVSPGCFAGDTVIRIGRLRGRTHSFKNYTLRELWDKQAGNTNRKNRAWRKDRKTVVCSYIDHLGKISNREICLIESGGIQKCLRVNFEGGHITGAPEHRVLTKEGWKRIYELVPGDELASCGKGKSVGKQVKYKTRTIAVWNHPYARTRVINGKTYQEYPFQRCVYEANASGISLDEYLSKLKANDLDGLKFLDKKYHIHHINGDHYDNRAENLKAVTIEQHARIHDVYANLKTHTLVYKKVLSVEDAGEQDTYCIMLEPAYLGHPSFLANDVFVHNFGKSLLLQYFITWCFARSKHCMFCYVAYGERLIKKLSRESRNLMMMPEWEELFGKEMDPGDKSVLNYHLISGGVRSGLTAGTVSSAMLGLDAGNPSSPDEFYSGDLLLDDINSPEVISSVHEQIETPEVYQRKLATRRRTPRTGTICIMQRHHVNDFAGWVAKNEPEEWEWVIIPAIDEEGNSFYPKRYPIEELRRIEKQNPFMFAAMYQQNPVENYGAYFHEDWIRTYRATPEKFTKVFITTDFGFTTSGDKSLFCCWGLANDNNLYLLRSRVGKWESPDAKKQCVDFFNHCNAAFRICRRVYVENTLSGLGFIQEMRRECPQMAIVPLKRGAKKNKMNRAESAMTWMEAGRVYFREADPNYVGARSELLSYNPSDKNPKDEWCFVAGTKVMTVFGEKNIEDIKVGDLLWTPIGITKVLKTGHRIKPVITNLGLTGTEDHKIWNPLHFRFDNLGDVCYFEPRLIQRSIQWKILKSYLMVNGINLTSRQDIISSTTKTMRKETGKRFTGLFGNIIREKGYLRAMLFIILTGIGVTTTILTLCAFRLLNMLKFMGGVTKQGNGLKRILKRCKTLLKKHALGIKAQKEEQKVLKCQEEPWTKSKKSELACCAESNSITSLQNGQTTEKSVITAKTAGNTKQNAVVYSIKTGNGVYVANSVLVSNCDNIGDATEIAFNTKVGSIFI